MARPETAAVVGAGTVFAGTYEIKRLLGRGGMGAVWEATHARLPGKRVAIKVLHAEAAADQESLARFRREAEIASRLGHPNIVEVHDFNQLEDGTPYLVLEYLQGSPLDQRLAAGPLPVEQAIALARQIGSALRAAHREGVIHRDLKPQNVFLTRTTDGAGDETEMAKVLDFGISKIRGSQTIKTHDSTILGTPQYMAPEQATGNHAAVDARTDIFAFGALVYEMLAGQPAFTGQTIPEVVFKVVYEQPKPLGELAPVTPAIAAAVHRALAKKPEDRFESIQEMVEALSGTALSMRGPPVAPGLAHAATIAPVTGEEILGSAATVASGNLEVIELEPAAPPAPVAATAAGPPAAPKATATPAPRSARKGLIAAIAAIAVSGAAAAGYLVSQPSEPGPADPPTSEASPSKATAPAPPGASASAPALADAGVATASAEAAADTAAAEQPQAIAAAAQPPPTRTSKPPPSSRGGGVERTLEPAIPEPSPAGDTALPVGDPRADLAAARGLIDSNPREVIRLIHRALRNGGKGAPYLAVKAMAHCKLLDLTQTNATLAQIRARAVRRRVIARCRRYGMELE
jgi:serine/threonine-protein kinase